MGLIRFLKVVSASLRCKLGKIIITTPSARAAMLPTNQKVHHLLNSFQTKGNRKLQTLYY